MRPIISTLCLALSCFATETLEAAELKQETSSAFSRYVVLTEERMARSLHDGDSFYSMGGKPELQREALRIRLRQGEIIIDQMETLDGDRPITVPGGLVHHWIALGFIPGVNLNQALALLQDYEQYPVVYQPDVKRSKLLSTDGTHFNIYLRLYQKTIVTAVFNAEFEVTYFRVDERRAHSRSYSKRIAEVENPDLPKERERPVGNDRGFLWRLYSYWRLEERDGGIYVELESVGLSRSVPVFFAWLVNPLLKSLPKSYLSRVLNSTRTALTKRQPAAGEKAARAGDALSQFKVGWAYYTGAGLKKDKDLAEKWFSQSSDNGRGQASYYIAVMYWNGEAGHTSFASVVATDHFAKAARFGQKDDAVLIC